MSKCGIPWGHYPIYAEIQEYEAPNYFSARRRRKKWTGWRPKNDEAKIEFQKTVMGKEDDKQEENLGTLQKDIEENAGKVAHGTKKLKRNFVKRTPENVRIREEAAARCTKVIK